MSFRIKNWKLAVLAFVFIGLFICLGFWQLSRADQKKVLLKSFAARTQHTPLAANQLEPSSDWRFYRAQLEGVFDNQYTMLLDNRNFHGQIGYEIYTLFHAQGLTQPILVDRGFVPLTRKREVLPLIRDISGTVSITGMLNLPPAYFALGQINESPQITWPLRIEYVKLSELSKLLNLSGLYPYVLMLEPHDPAAYAMEWEIVTMGPEKHLGYAVQWFALALTLLILFVVLNRDRTINNR